MAGEADFPKPDTPGMRRSTRRSTTTPSSMDDVGWRSFVPSDISSDRRYRPMLIAASQRPGSRASQESVLPSGHAEFLTTPATADDRQRWKGWCEVESEPAFFNVMLREYGVQGIKVQEVVSLDEEMLMFLPKPINGLVFLFKFKEDDPSKQEATCPDHVWFANQTTSNACASIALLNIVMNVPDIKLGPVLDQLKDFSIALSPALRGYTVENHDYIRQIHNSFTRKMDMLNADLFLSNDANSKKFKKKFSSSKKAKPDDDDNGFHFIAFVPIDGCVWKLDGLERQPMNLGGFEDNWMDLARPMITERMQQYEDDQIQFNLLAICRSPLLSVPEELADNIKTLAVVESQLYSTQSDWKLFMGSCEADSVLRGPNVTYNITQDLINSAQPKLWVMKKLEEKTVAAASLLEIHQELVNSQVRLRATYVDEVSAIDQDNERAMGRRHDFTPLIHVWIRILANKGFLQPLVEGSLVG